MSESPRSFRILLEELRQGDAAAADRIVQEYTDALTAVARRQIGSKLGRRVDAEDVLQSVYRSFFGRVGDGQYDLGSGRDIWNLLVRMTLNKIAGLAQHHQAAKRALERERPVAAGSQAVPLDQLATSDGPNPVAAAMLIEEVEILLGALTERERPVVELRLQGYSTTEISEEIGRPERSIRRVIERLKVNLATAANGPGHEAE